MISTPRLLDQLASLTAIRDLELMEFSLIKTVKGFLLPRSIRLVRLNSKGLPTMEIRYGEDKCAVIYNDLTQSHEITHADDYLTASDAPFHCAPTNEGLSVVFPLSKSRAWREYLQLLVNDELTKLDTHLMAGVLQIYRNFVSLMRHSQTDQLTGLANRKTFDDCVAKVHELIPYESEPVAHDRRISPIFGYWLVMIDIDNFKQVNDRFGHLYGDEVLVILAQQMQAAFRADDMIFRFGGEEFVLIVRCDNQTACAAMLERFRTTVSNRSIPQVGTVTISMGVTHMERKTFSATIVDHADQALYHSKRNGRNQVTFFEDLVQRGIVILENIKTEEIDFF
jgi:diguanylate cyclase (GGDEF)-like protein